MQLKELIDQADALKSEIDMLRPLKPEVENRILQKFRLDWNYHSNAIEGNSLTLGETRAFLLEGLTANGKPIKDHLDIRGHDDLITFLEFFIQRKERLTEAAIREMHRILLKEPYETDAITADGRIVKKKVNLGEYKREPNGVRMGSGQIHQYTLPEDVSSEMAKLIDWYRQQEASGDSHPVLFAALFHHRFVSIHPFDDGNGRMARILMNLILMRSGFPPVVIKLQDRESYVAALRRADANEPDAIVSFVGQGLIDAESLYLRGAHGESIEDADDIDKSVALLKQELKHAPTPTSLSRDVQQKHFHTQLFPFLQRLNAKLTQFDDLFAESNVSANYSARIIGGGQLGQSSFNCARNDLQTRLQQVHQPHQVEFSNLNFYYRWEGFLRDGPNDFSISSQIKISYELRKMEIEADWLKLRRLMLYGEWFSEDEIKDLLNSWAKHILTTIQSRRSKK